VLSLGFLLCVLSFFCFSGFFALFFCSGSAPFFFFQFVVFFSSLASSVSLEETEERKSFFFSVLTDLSFSGFYSQRTIRFFQPLIAGVMAAMAAAGVR
jgi:hypothetical protein